MHALTEQVTSLTETRSKGMICPGEEDRDGTRALYALTCPGNGHQIGERFGSLLQETSREVDLNSRLRHCRDSSCSDQRAESKVDSQRAICLDHIRNQWITWGTLALDQLSIRLEDYRLTLPKRKSDLLSVLRLPRSRIRHWEVLFCRHSHGRMILKRIDLNHFCVSHHHVMKPWFPAT
jgi:hypothetical protein